jgi:hypothetical protein
LGRESIVLLAHAPAPPVVGYTSRVTGRSPLVPDG